MCFDGYKNDFFPERITEHFYIHFIMKAFLTSVLFSASVLLAQECPEMPPMECADGDILCPMGADDNGCSYPEVCMPSGSACPEF